MKRGLFFVLAVLLLSGCHREDKAIRLMCEEIHLRYPAATLQDVYKTCYQDFFGAEHLVRDTASARMYLHRELEECCETDLTRMPVQEPTGFRHRFTRVNLSNVVNGDMSEEQLLAMFLTAAGEENAAAGNWAEEWGIVCKIALQVCPDWADSALQAELRQVAQQNQAVRHSDAFRNTYNPHYRIIKRLPSEQN